jgi:hypothetical protein
MTPDHLIQRYCECARSVWNSFLLRDDVDEFAVKRFDGIRRLLFQAIVLAPLDLDDDRQADDEPFTHLQVIAGTGPLTVLVEQPSKDGDRYWEAAPKDLDFSGAQMQFVDLFDWDPQGFRDMSLVMAWIISGPPGGDLDRRYALFERQSVTVVVKDMSVI